MSGKARTHLIRFARYLVAVLCFWLVYRIIMGMGPRRVWQGITHADPRVLLLSFAGILVYFVLWAYKWWRMIGRFQDGSTLSFFLLGRLIMAGGLVNLLTPTAKLGGGFYRAIFMQKTGGISFASAYGQVLADQVTGMLGRLGLTGLLATSASFLPTFAPWRGPLLFGGAWALVFCGLWLVFRRWLMQWLAQKSAVLKRWPPAFLSGSQPDWARHLTDPLQRASPMENLSDLLLAALGLAIFCWSNALAIKALGSPVSLLSVALVVMLAYLAGTLLGIMGGAGVTELFLIGMYTRIGLPQEIAAAGALIHRALYYGVILLGGGLSMWSLGRLKSRLGD